MMNARYLQFGNIKLYVFLDDAAGEENALLMCKAFGYKMYKGASKIGKEITCDCYSGYLQRKEKLKETSVCTVGKTLYDTLDLLEESIEVFEELTPQETLKKEIKESLLDKKLVFIAGRGIGSRSNYERLKKLANKYGASMGCSRPVAMNGWESYDNFVGISGNVLSLATVVCFGVAGATPFLKGIENCKTIIAINNDKNALIFKQADYGIVDDCMNVISYLENI